MKSTRVVFGATNGGAAMCNRKAQPRQRFTIWKDIRADFLEACAAAWTARRTVPGQAGRFPVAPEGDERDLDMAIWY